MHPVTEDGHLTPDGTPERWVVRFPGLVTGDCVTGGSCEAISQGVFVLGREPALRPGLAWGQVAAGLPGAPCSLHHVLLTLAEGACGGTDVTLALAFFAGSRAVCWRARGVDEQALRDQLALTLQPGGDCVGAGSPGPAAIRQCSNWPTTISIIPINN